MLVEIENVQFKENELGKTFGNLDNSTTVDRGVESLNGDCVLKNKL